MRDSRIGTYGSLALVLVLLLKYAALTTIAKTGLLSESGANTTAWSMAATLVLAHVLSRWSILPMTRFRPYAREQSCNKVFADGVTDHRLLTGSLISLAVLIICSTELGMSAYIAFVATLAVIWLSRRWYLRTLDGITGDCLGATNQLVELVVYLSVAGVVGA
jgi:adenosylcobinamide-GDP ribazoletransferase